MSEYNFEQLPIYQKEFEELFKRHPEQYLKSQKNINMTVLKEMQTRVVKGYNIIASIFGQTGSGKSYASLSFAQFISVLAKRPFNPDNICFKMEAVIEKIEGLEKNDILILDEQIREFGIGKDRQISELRNIEETIRKKQIHFIFNSPDVRTHLHHLMLQTFAIDYERKVQKLLVYTPSREMIGYVTLAMPTKAVIARYEPMKDKFLEEVKERTTSKKGFLKDKAEKMLEDGDFPEGTTNDEKLTIIREKYPNYNTPEHKEILNWVKIIQKESQ